MKAKNLHFDLTRHLLFLVSMMLFCAMVLEPCNDIQIKGNTVFLNPSPMMRNPNAKQISPLNSPDALYTGPNQQPDAVGDSHQESTDRTSEVLNENSEKVTGLECEVRTDGSIACSINQ